VAAQRVAEQPPEQANVFLERQVLVGARHAWIAFVVLRRGKC
jgi:hypothetical protein